MKFKKLDPEAILPKYEHKGNSGFDKVFKPII